MKNMSLFSLLCMAGLLLACGGGDEGSIPSGTPDIGNNDKRGIDCSFYRWIDKPYSGKWGKQGRSN